MSEPFTILNGTYVMTLIYPTMLLWTDKERSNTWYYGQPKTWNQAVALKYPPKRLPVGK